MRQTIVVAVVLVALGTTISTPCVGADSAVVKEVAMPDTTQKANQFYVGNREPLRPNSLIPLPCGTIQPRGWLRKQLELEADGFVGHLTEISSFCNPKGNAWLSPDGMGGGSWEEVPYWLRGFTALGYVLRDKRVMEEAKPWIENLFASQQANGYFGPKKNLEGGKGPDLMPNMNMLYVLRLHYEYTGDKRVLDLMAKYFKWEMTLPDNQFYSGGWQVPRNGDNMDSVFWLYNRTGDKTLLELTAKLQRCGSSWLKPVTGGHNVDFAQGFRKPALFFQQNKEASYLETSIKNWEGMMGIYGQVPGGTFGGDEFARPGYTDPRQAIETCGIVEMMHSEEIMYRITGDGVWADRCENAALNSLPAALTADMKALRYLTSANQSNSDRRSKAPELADAGPMQVMNPHDHRCCQHNCGFGWPMFAMSLWHATPGNGLAATFYAANTVNAKVGTGVAIAISEETKYPFDGVVKFTLSPAAPVKFPLYLRVPGWCMKAQVMLNKQKLAIQAKPGSFIMIDHVWAKGDTVELVLPMELTTTTWTENKNSVSVNRGPLTFSIKIGEEYRKSGGSETWPAWEIIPTSAWNYALVLDTNKLALSLKAVPKAWPTNDMVFTHVGTPVEILAQAKRLPNWQEDHLGLVDKLQPSPVKSTSKTEVVTMIPMGAARLRIAAIPVIGTGPEAKEWKLPPEPIASYTRGIGVDPVESVFDGKLPKNSSDTRTPRFTTFCFGGAEDGKLHWVKKNFDKPTTVSQCEVYWVQEPGRGAVQLPKSWRVKYLSGKEWKDVENASGYGVLPDTLNKVTFKPVTTTVLKLEVQCQERLAMGIYEWQMK